MDIHKPKPVHNWREFIKEIGIIVIGVGIALSAEQLLASLHNAQLAGQTRATARAELQAAFNDVLNRRATQSCIDRRLDEVAGLIAASNQPVYKPPSWIGRPQFWIINTSGWDAATQAARAALLGQEEQAQFGRLYGQLREFQQLERDEQKAWAAIRQLEDQPQVDAQMRASVRSALQQARLTNWNIRVDLEQSEALAERIGVLSVKSRLKGSPSICMPMGMKRPDAVAKANRFFGDTLGEP